MDFLNEVRYGMRVLLKSPGFTVIAALTLAVCIAANAAIFSMADAAFRPYPFRQLDRLMALSETIPQVSAERYDVSAGNFFDWKSRAHALEPMEAYKAWSATLMGRDEAEQVQGYLVSPGFFSLLGVAPMKGRVFSETARLRILTEPDLPAHNPKGIRVNRGRKERQPVVRYVTGT